MSTTASTSAPLRLRGLLDVMRAVHHEEVPTLLDGIARAVCESLGYGTAVVNLYRPAWDDFEVAAVHGNDDARALLLGELRPRAAWASLLHPRFRTTGGAYFVRHGEFDWDADGMKSFVPALSPAADADAWDPEDALLVPITGSDGELLGVLSVDEPASGRVPGDDELELLAAVAAQAALAVETAQRRADAERDRAALARLLEVSSRLTEMGSTDEMLRSVCDGIRDALGFQRVSIELLEADRTFAVRAAAGWDEDELRAAKPMALATVEPLLVPEHERHGCHLLTGEEAAARLPGVRLAYRSVQNGRGPRGWAHHWLLVPLRDRADAIRGLIWVDDPADCLIPSAERLQALRTFANQAAAALERKRADEEALEAAERFRLAALATRSAVYRFDYETSETQWTEGVTRVFGYPVEAETSSYDWWLERIHPDDRERIEAAGGENVVDGAEYEHMYRVRAADGRYRDVIEAGVVHVRDGQAKAIGAVMDVTDRRELEQQLRQSQKLEAIGRLAGGVAHDFNNLLTAITGYGELALGKAAAGRDPTGDIREALRSAERAAGLTRQLLAFGRRQIMQPRVVDLNRVVADLDRLLRRLIGEHVELETRTHARPATVEVDQGQVEQVVVNLALNARDAMPAGGRLVVETALVDVPADAPDGLDPGRYVRLAVRDTGTGMDEATRERVFEPFFTTKEPGKGTGLGLATAYGVMQQSGGAIRAESAPGEGSTFELLFPLVHGEEPAEPAAEVAVGPDAAATVLLVEDEDVVRTLVRDVLEERGFAVLDAPGPDAALDVAAGREAPIDLLLTDVVMPSMSGRELARRFAALHPESRLLYMSGYTDGAIVQHGVLAEGTMFLQKPFTMDALVAKIGEVLRSEPAPA